MAKKSRRTLWIFWGVLTLLMATYLTTGMLYEKAAHNALLAPARALFLPGQTTHGHHQIELACETCHTSPFGGKEHIQEACVGCHGAELKEARDTHPASKFNDPRNAERLEKIDAQACITCHTEHRPEMTQAMGVTRPDDVCFHCHSGPEEMPPDHAGFAFDGCTAAGCHNYHDNRALYEDFLLKHASDPALNDKRILPLRELGTALQETMAYPHERFPIGPLAAGSQDAPKGKQGDAKLVHEWLTTAHAQAGVNCSACHMPVAADGTQPGEWIDRPSEPATCQGCHALEVKGFQAGKHGMRSAAGLSPMTPADARLPMHADAAHRELSCTSCHGAHAFDTRVAAVESCVGCHDDVHTRAYKKSQHYELWRMEIAGELPPGSGVSCASCHMPRLRMSTDEGSRMAVQHNQNDVLRPNEKMIRPVCQSCHGLGFSIDALADPALIERNFTGMPARHVESIDLAVKKEEERLRARARSATDATAEQEE